MNWADGINIFLSASVLILTFAMFKLNKTMTKIAEDDKKEKTDHSLTVTLPMSYGAQPNGGFHLRDIAIVNNKNKTENIYKIFLKKDGKEIPFWHAIQVPLVVPPYDCKLVTANAKNPFFKDLTQFQFFAVTNDKTVELDKNINCYDKPFDKQEAQ